MNYLKVTNAAKIKGVSRAAVTQAVASGKIHQKMIDGTPYILENRAFEVWNPGVKK
ncbi:hypothetical protein LCGC14_2601120 [marine sediment metagenome]|uniref:Helix-turn-helix domain-containing protein n=1 Tax=marine sediment metagenome TaxID=412755 RepID=A0A0F9D1F4_9ZZZZ